MKNFIEKKLAANRIEKLLRNYPNKILLNVGCGTDYKTGWINIDNNSDGNIKKLDLNWDMRNPLPFKDNSADYIFNEHFIEHLKPEESRMIISDLMRVLKSGGVLRVATPDLEVLVDKYLNIEINDDPNIHTYRLEFIKTKAERLNIGFSWWGHKWIYDFEELERRFKEVGYGVVKRCKQKESHHLDLKNLETRDGPNLIVEVTK